MPDRRKGSLELDPFSEESLARAEKELFARLREEGEDPEKLCAEVGSKFFDAPLEVLRERARSSYEEGIEFEQRVKNIRERMFGDKFPEIKSVQRLPQIVSEDGNCYFCHEACEEENYEVFLTQPLPNKTSVIQVEHISPVCPGCVEHFNGIFPHAQY